jgi:hypothetical protein
VPKIERTSRRRKQSLPLCERQKILKRDEIWAKEIMRHDRPRATAMFHITIEFDTEFRKFDSDVITDLTVREDVNLFVPQDIVKNAFVSSRAESFR